jgi:hypothetical protein
MDLPRLAAKQKRYKDILKFTNTEVGDAVLKPSLLHTLAQYRLALAECWRRGAVTPEASSQIDSIERELEKLHNDARLRTAQK